MASPAAASETSTLIVNVFDGTRKLLEESVHVQYRIYDGNQNIAENISKPNSSLKFTELRFFDNFGDNYRVVVSADGYYTAGFTPVPLKPSQPVELDLMLLPKKNVFDFGNAGWEEMRRRFPFLAAGSPPDEAAARYEELRTKRQLALASLLNLCTAMSQIFLPQGTPLQYLKEVIWDQSLAQDRFFAYTDPKLMDQVKLAAQHGLFAPEFGSGFFHPGATASWKQVQFGEANLQLTFHENTKKTIDGVNCIVVEPDIDYYKDLGAHGLLEVIPNKVSGGLTNPEMVYVLRWIAGRRAGIPEFDPPYFIVQA